MLFSLALGEKANIFYHTQNDNQLITLIYHHSTGQSAKVN